jgi:hypothetical protein
MPEDFMAENGEAAEQELLVDPNKLIEMANLENEKMLAGEPLIGTPLSTVEHTLLHIEFMKSEEFKGKATPEIIKNFAGHVFEEAMAQNARGKSLEGQAAANQPPTAQATGQMGAELNPQSGGMMPEAQGIMAGDAKATMPNKMLGSEMLPDFIANQSRKGPRFA